ncbi:hypothetical protein AMECASPLE_019473 [Ameca splendens]|uniref:Uncharacterized protein n=1 Tax=Ameca splendens TaxID=208324 RepID=A0ABV0YPX7_9TELE
MKQSKEVKDVKMIIADLSKFENVLQLPRWTGQMSSGETFYAQTRQRLTYFATMTRSMFRQGQVTVLNLRISYQLSSTVVVVSRCLASLLTGVLHKMDKKMSEDNLQISSASSWLKLGHI